MLQDELATALGLKKSQLSKFKKRGCPVDDVGEAKRWIATNIRRRTKRIPCPTSDDEPQDQPVPADDGFTPEARLERARKMEKAIYEATAVAVHRKEYGSLQSLLASYQRALQGITDAEASHVEARLQSSELIHRDTAQALLSEILIPIRNALDNLPMTERTRCNPANPKVAEVALRAWKDGLLITLSQLKTTF